MPKSKYSQIIAILCLLGLSCIWGYNWVMMKIAVQYASPFTFAALRAFYGALSLFLVMICLGKSIRPKEIWTTFCVGILQHGGFIGLATYALVSGGAGKTAILTYTMSFWLLILAWIFLGERLRQMQWIGIFLSFIGLIFILLPFSSTSGVVSKGLAVLAGFSWATSAVITKKLQQKMQIDLLSFTAWQMLFGFLPLALVNVFLQFPPINWSPAFIYALVYNVVPGSALAWLLWLYALKNLPAGIAGLGALLTPILGILASSIQLGEIPSSTELIGMVMIIMALLVNTLSIMGLNKEKVE